MMNTIVNSEINTSLISKDDLLLYIPICRDINKYDNKPKIITFHSITENNKGIRDSIGYKFDIRSVYRIILSRDILFSIGFQPTTVENLYSYTEDKSTLLTYNIKTDVLTLTKDNITHVNTVVHYLDTLQHVLRYFNLNDALSRINNIKL